MVYWRNFLQHCQNFRLNLRRALEPYLAYDYDRCLDLIIIGGGIRPIPGAEPWKYCCLILYQLLGYCQFIISFSRVVFSINNGDDLIGLCASIVVLACIITISVKIYILEHYGDAIRQSKDFINSKWISSGDPDYDANARRNHSKSNGKVTLAVFLLLCFDQVILLVPCSARDRIYGVPEQFYVLGDRIANLLRESFVLLLPIFWGSRYFCASLTILPILIQLKSELMVVARGYETIEPRGRIYASNELMKAARTSRKFSSDKGLMLKHMKQLLGINVQQHVEVLRMIHLMQPLVSHLYAIKYYSVMFIVSLLVFLLIKSGVTFVFAAVFASTGVFALECYSWCRIIDSIQDAMEMIAESVAHLGYKLEYSVESHKEYMEMRTSIMIVQLNASQSGWFSCADIFTISVESFGNLCMIVYKLATFLLDSDG